MSGWLHDRNPEPPPALMASIENALATRAGRNALETAATCIDAADESLRDLLAQPSAGRESALDLLTVDALVTYAFEAASTEPDSLTDLATAAMRRFASAAAHP